MKILRFLALFFASAMVLREVFEVLMRNELNADENLTYIVPDSVEYGGVALCVVGLSIFLKRDIWAYLFFFAIVVSFFPILSFTNAELSIFIGPIKLDMITIPLLVAHVLLNVHLIRFPKLSAKESEESTSEKVDYFIKIFEKKSDEELLRMDEKEMVSEAIEARKKLILERSL